MDGRYGKGLLQGLSITLRNFIDTYIEDIRWLGKSRYFTPHGIANRQSTDARGIFTVQYPEEKLPVPEEFRFIPFLVYEVDENGDKHDRCTSCGICAKVCPPQCIWIVRTNDPIVPEARLPVHLQVVPAPDIALVGPSRTVTSVQDFFVRAATTHHELEVHDRTVGDGRVELIGEGNFWSWHSATARIEVEGTYLVTITEFMDPACETCRAFDPFLKQMLAAYPGKMKLVVRYAPLHQSADYMCAILEAARKQGKYWETRQLMYDTQPQWTEHHHARPELFWKFPPRIGLNVDRLKKDMADPAIAQLIQQDMADARTLQVTKTPGFFVNGKPLVVFGYDQLRSLIESELRANY